MTTEKVRLNNEQKRRITAITKWHAGLLGEVDLYCNEDDIRTSAVIDQLTDLLVTIEEIIEDDEILQKWHTTL